jgi:hypothetical protein
MVVTISPSLSLYRMVVFPAASRPTIRIRISLRPHSLSKSLEKVIPILKEPRSLVTGTKKIELVTKEGEVTREDWRERG